MNATENKFYLLFEYGVGGEIDPDALAFVPGQAHNSRQNDPGYRYSTAHLPLCKQLKLGNGIRFWANDDDLERVEQHLSEGYAAMVDIFCPWYKFAEKKGQPARAYCDRFIDRCRELVKKYPDQVWFNPYTEFDNRPWREAPGTFATRKEVFAALKKFIADDLGIFPSAVSDGKLIGPLQYLRERRIRPEELNLVALCCQTFTTHLLYDLGMRHVWPQGNVGNSHQLTVAFVRGAARQYGRTWCYDFAPFDCQGSEMPTAYDRRRRRFAGFSEEYFLRAWMLGYLSGAHTFLFQTSDLTFFIKQKDGSRELSPLGELAKDFADFTLRRHPDRGETVAPVGLLLPSDHGYSPAFHNASRVFWKKLPDDRINREIEGFFRVAFPGCNDTHGYSFDTGRWAPNGSWANQQPWIKPGLQSAADVAKSFHREVQSGYDNRPQEKAFLTASTWGDSFDVLTDNTALDALRQYRGLIVGSGLKLTAKLRKKLQDYVCRGGKLLLNIASVGPDDSSWLGLQLTGRERITLYHSHSVTTGRRFDEGYYRFAEVVPTTAEVLIYTGEFGENNYPLVTRNRYGHGEVWITMTPENQADDKYDITLLEASKEALDSFIRPLLSVSVQGKPIHWALNRNSTGYWLALFNNTETAWEGQITLLDIGPITEVREIWNEKAVAHGCDDCHNTTLTAALPPWQFKIFELKTQSKSQQIKGI